MPYGRLLDENAHYCEALSDLSYPVVLLQGRKSGGDRFVECLRGDLYGVLECSTSLTSFTATMHVLRTTRRSVSYSRFVRQLTNA